MYNRKPMEKSTMDPNLSFRKIMKDVELFGSSHMTWKDKKALENKKVIELGGKPQKKQRLPLSVARVQMKRQKEREEKMSEQSMILGRFGGQFNVKKPADKKRKPEERVLKSMVGSFKGGVLDVRHMLHSSGPSSRSNGERDINKLCNYGMSKSRGKGDKKKKKKKKGGKKKGKH